MTSPRRSRLRSVPAIVAAAALLAGLAACTPAEFEPAEIVPLSCIDDMWNGGPVRGATVDCTSPHRFEVVSVIDGLDIPAELVDRETIAPGDLYTRLVLDDEADALASWYRSLAGTHCTRALNEVLGFDALMVEGMSGVDLGLRVAAPYSIVWSLATAEDFAAGDERTLCAIAWLDGQGGLAPTAHQAGADLRALVGPGLALDRRECLVFVDGASAATPCADPHAGQVIVDVDALRALGVDWVAQVDPANGRARAYSAADAVCEDVLTALLPAGTLTPARSVWADIRPTDGWVDFDGTVDAERRYPISCAVISADRSATLTGDLWG